MDQRQEKLIQKLPSSKLASILPIIIIAVALIGGAGTGYALSSNQSSSPSLATPGSGNTPLPSTAAQDNRTFKDFAEGTIQPKPTPSSGEDYSEGTHLLIRANAVPVALTSSVVDLNKYVGKKVKVYGETQKALKEGWLMDVGKVEIE